MRVLVIVSALAALLGVGGSLNSESSTTLYQSEWQAFVTRFIPAEGRVSDTGNKEISHSEGQGYGMVMATAFDDRAAFDRLWQWSKTNLQVRGDHLFAWKWEPGPAKATDTNSASDGDILIAWACCGRRNGGTNRLTGRRRSRSLMTSAPNWSWTPLSARCCCPVTRASLGKVRSC